VTIQAWDPNAIVKKPLLLSSTVYVPGVTTTTVPAFYASNTIGTALTTTTTTTTTNSNPFPPLPMLPLLPRIPVATTTYIPTYVGFGSALPLGLLGTLNAYATPFLVGQTVAPTQYLTTQITTSQVVPTTTTWTVTGSNLLTFGTSFAAKTEESGGHESP